MKEVVVNPLHDGWSAEKFKTLQPAHKRAREQAGANPNDETGEMQPGIIRLYTFMKGKSRVSIQEILESLYPGKDERLQIQVFRVNKKRLNEVITERKLRLVNVGGRGRSAYEIVNVDEVDTGEKYVKTGVLPEDETYDMTDGERRIYRFLQDHLGVNLDQALEHLFPEKRRDLQLHSLFRIVRSINAKLKPFKREIAFEGHIDIRQTNGERLQRKSAWDSDKKYVEVSIASEKTVSSPRPNTKFQIAPTGLGDSPVMRTPPREKPVVPKPVDTRSTASVEGLQIALAELKAQGALSLPQIAKLMGNDFPLTRAYLIYQALKKLPGVTVSESRLCWAKGGPEHES